MNLQEEDKNYPKKGEESTSELGKLFEALAKAQSEMCAAKTDKTNPYFKSKYADLFSVIRSSRPYLTKNGLSVIQRMGVANDSSLNLYTRLCHSSGQWIESCVPINPAKQDVQTLGSYITYMKRYTYSAITGTVSGNEDDDGETAMSDFRKNSKTNITKSHSSKIDDRELKTLSEMLSGQDGKIIEKTLKQFKILKFSDLDKERFNECVSFILKVKKEH